MTTVRPPSAIGHWPFILALTRLPSSRPGTARLTPAAPGVKTATARDGPTLAKQGVDDVRTRTVAHGGPGRRGGRTRPGTGPGKGRRVHPPVQRPRPDRLDHVPPETRQGRRPRPRHHDRRR